MPSKAPDDERRLLHIRDNIYLARRFAEGLEYGEFRDDIKTLYAVTRCLEIISEASRYLTPALKQRHPQILWKDMAGAGSVYRHDYEDVAARYVWSTLQRDLAPLLVVVEHELGIVPTARMTILVAALPPDSVGSKREISETFSPIRVGTFLGIEHIIVMNICESNHTSFKKNLSKPYMPDCIIMQ